MLTPAMAALGIDSVKNDDNQQQCLSGTSSNNIMNDDREYELLNVINHGSFGIVYKARDKKTGRIVAMKQEFHGFSRSTLREITILDSLPRHPSIVEFKQVCQDNRGRVFVVMEYLEDDLQRFMHAHKKHLTISEVKFVMKKILEGVGFLHDNGLMHRDLKPANILMNCCKGELKICDFGLSCNKFRRLNTPHVGTLWYKAPEVLVGAKTYSSAVDMWGVGCIMAELILRKVVYQGRSEIHQLGCIHNNILRGGPNSELGLNLLSAAHYGGAPLLTRCGFDLLESLLCYDPRGRITAKEALNHGWFREFYGFSAV